MNPENWQNFFQIMIAVGLIMTATGGYGYYHFGKQIDKNVENELPRQFSTGSGDNISGDKYENNYYFEGKQHYDVSDKDRPFISCGKQIEIKSNSLIFHFKNVGNIQAEDVRIRTFEILRKSQDLEEYDRFVLENINKEGKLYGIIPPNDIGNVSWTLAPDEKTGKVHLDKDAILVLQIDYNYNRKKAAKRFFAFYGYMNFHGQEVISLKRQIEIDQ